VAVGGIWNCRNSGRSWGVAGARWQGDWTIRICIGYRWAAAANGNNKFNEHARAQLKSKQIYYAPFEQRINLRAVPQQQQQQQQHLWQGQVEERSSRGSIRLSQAAERLTYLAKTTDTQESSRLTWPIDRRIANATVACSLQRSTCNVQRGGLESVRDLQTAPHLANIYRGLVSKTT